MSLGNVTISSGNDTTSAITYGPALCNGQGWSLVTNLSGSYKFCTLISRDASPSVNLTFTGVAVYYLPPPVDAQSVSFTLDEAVPVTVNISQPEDSSSALIAQVVWNATSLNNTQHILQLHPISDNKTLSVGSFIISQQVDPNSSSTPSGAALPPALASELASLGPPIQSARTTRVAIGLGTTFGSLSFIIFLFISLFLWRRNNIVRKRYSWTPPVPPIRSSIKPTTIQSHSQSLDSCPSPQTRSNIQMNPIASVEPGTSIHEYDGEEPSGSKGWVSPALSHSPLVQNKSSSPTHGHDDPPPAPSAYKLQPLRTRSDSGSVSGQSTFGQAFVSRNTTVPPKLEPVRTPSVQSYTQRSPPLPFTETVYVTDMASNASVSRNATFRSARLEPVRRGSSTNPAPER